MQASSMHTETKRQHRHRETWQATIDYEVKVSKRVYKHQDTTSRYHTYFNRLHRHNQAMQNILHRPEEGKQPKARQR